MGLSLSLLSSAWIEVVWNELVEVQAALVRLLSFGEGNIKMIRCRSLKRSDSGTKMSSGNLVLRKSLSFKLWESMEEIKPETGLSIENQNMVDSQIEFTHCKVEEDDPLSGLKPAFSSPRPLSELDAAAVKVQKVYKSYRTRRNLADCAVVVEELWWKALDFASLKRSSVSFFDDGKQETAVSRWSRARTKAAKVGKGLSKDEKAQKLALRHWLEAIDPRHRYGHNLHLYYDVWFSSESTQPFFYWLDVGEGREVNLEKCPRNKLQQQCIKYLGPNAREAYEVIVENGKLVYRQSDELVNTTDVDKWIFVLSTLRTLYVGQKKKGTFQHSSFLAGGATTAAGRLVAKDGVLEAIWPYSGHYLPTEENFKDFISFLQENDVDLTNVKRYSVDDEEVPAFQKSNSVEEAKTEAATAAEEADQTEAEINLQEPAKTELLIENDKATEFEFSRHLSCRWTTGTGPRIGCVRDYPSELQYQALEQLNLSPKIFPSPTGNKVPIPSPRPSPKIRLSPRLESLAYMSIPAPTVCLSLPRPKRGNPKLRLPSNMESLAHISIPTPTVSLTLPKLRSR